MNDLTRVILTVLGSVVASSGFWAFLQFKFQKSDINTRMLLGLAHDRIISLGMMYIDRGDWITQDEYENLYEYLYVPYLKMGGNGTAKKIMETIQKLRIIKSATIREIA